MAYSKKIPDETGDEENHLTDCGICLSEIENPKALPCLHSFCLKCLKQVKHPPGVLTCPLCQENIPLPPGGVDGFRDNFIINQLKERRTIRNIRDVKMACICCRSTNTETVARCMDCNGFLCQQCVDLHKNITPLRVHTVFTIEELKSGKVEMSKVITPVGRDCTVMEHRHPEHDYVTMESTYEDQRAQIKKLVTNCKGFSQRVNTALAAAEAAEKELEEAVARVKTQIDNAKDEVKKAFLAALEKNHKLNTDKLIRIQAERYEKINATKKRLHNIQSKLNNAVEIANQVIKSGSMHDMALNYSTLSETLTQLKSMKVQGTNKNISQVKFRPCKQWKAEQVDLGSIYSSPLKAKDGKWVVEKELGTEGEGKLRGAYGVAVSPSRDIVVADYSDRNVKVFDVDGKLKQVIHCNLSHPHDVIASADGQYFVTDHTAHVKVYSPEGKYLKQFPAKSSTGISSDADGSRLFGVTIDNEGHLLVGSSTKYISKSNLEGTHNSTIKVNICPWFIAVTSQGRIIVTADSYKTGAQVLDDTGNILHTINAPKDTKSWWPCGVCCSDDDVIYINSRDTGDQGGIYSFTEEGEYLGCVATDLINTAGMALTEDDRLVVAQCGKYPAKIFSFKCL